MLCLCVNIDELAIITMKPYKKHIGCIRGSADGGFMALLRGCYICCVLIMVVKRIANPWSLIRLVGSNPSHSAHLSTIAIHRYVSVEKESLYCIALEGF